VLYLDKNGFRRIQLLKTGPDILCEKNGKIICIEVKTVTKQSVGRQGEYLEDQLYIKLTDLLSKARSQLQAARSKLDFSLGVAAVVVNWPVHSMVLALDDFQSIVKRLEHADYLAGIDGVLLILAGGTTQGFLSNNAHSLLD
jgi:hypothetical protein